MMKKMKQKREEREGKNKNKKKKGVVNVVVNRGAWTAEEDHKLVEYVKCHGDKNWRVLPAKAGNQVFTILLLLLLVQIFKQYKEVNWIVCICRAGEMWQELQAEMAELFEAGHQEREHNR